MAFVAKIMENPDEKMTRLALSDWLEERASEEDEQGIKYGLLFNSLRKDGSFMVLKGRSRILYWSAGDVLYPSDTRPIEMIPKQFHLRCKLGIKWTLEPYQVGMPYPCRSSCCGAYARKIYNYLPSFGWVCRNRYEQIRKEVKEKNCSIESVLNNIMTQNS